MFRQQDNRCIRKIYDRTSVIKKVTYIKMVLQRLALFFFFFYNTARYKNELKHFKNENWRSIFCLYKCESNENLKHVLSRNLLNKKVHNDFIFLCSIVLPPVGHSSNNEYHCWNLQDNQAVVRIFIVLLRLSFESPRIHTHTHTHMCVYSSFTSFILCSKFRASRMQARFCQRFPYHIKGWTGLP